MRPRLKESLLRSVGTTGPCEFTAVACGNSASGGKSFKSTLSKVKGMFQIVEESCETPVRVMWLDYFAKVNAKDSSGSAFVKVSEIVPFMSQARR